MIDPFTALAGIQTAVELVKKVAATVDDVSSLGPVLGKYFDAKSTATKAVVEAKNSKKKSSMAAAIEIEMAIHQAEQFEKQLQLLFMQTGKIDVWNKIMNESPVELVEKQQLLIIGPSYNDSILNKMKHSKNTKYLGKLNASELSYFMHNQIDVLRNLRVLGRDK